MKLCSPPFAQLPQAPKQWYDTRDDVTKMNANKLTPKQERFCQTYVETGNATKAYRTAYDIAEKKPATVNRKANELLDHGKIPAKISAPQSERHATHEYTLDRIVRTYEEDCALVHE